MEKPDETILVTVKFGLQSIPITLPYSSRVNDLMQQLQRTTDVLPRVQKLIFKGKVLTPDMTLRNAQLTNGSKIMLMAAQGFQQRVNPSYTPSASFLARSASPTKKALTMPTRIDESRLKAWRLTGVVPLRDSGLQKVPASVWSLEASVRVLDVGGNCLMDLPVEVASLINLQRVRLSGNGLKDGTISWQSMCSLSQLTVLALEHNLLTTLPPEVGQLSSLKFLSARNNKLTTLPDEIGNLLLLEKLDLSNNCIQELPSSLGRCTQLSEANLSGNRLTSIPLSFSELLSLKTLLLDNNQLKDFPSEILRSCSQLKTLSLHWNQLTMEELRELDGWSEFDQRRKDKYTKQMDMQVMGPSTGFDEGADTERWQRW